MGEEIMKIAITTTGKDLSAAVDPRFGRAAYILIVDLDSMACEALDNSDNVQAFKGAGIQAASRVADKDVDVLMTGYCGPNAFKTLAAAGVKVVTDVSGTVQEAIAAFNSDKVKYSDGANVDGHW
jgi:predicted Fe-Mo cluster-binding NifX family protein